VARAESESTVAMLPAVEVEPDPAAIHRSVPPVISRRATLQRGLPSVYHSPGWLARRGSSAGFALQFVGALEQVLDPPTGLLDNLASHLSPELAPPDLLDLIAAWLGLELDETWLVERRRALVRHAPELARRRGTRAGLELALRLIFPDHPFRVVDEGRVLLERAPDTPPDRQFVVYCDAPLPIAMQAEVARVIEQLKPVGVDYRLRVKQPKKPTAE
jgi:phage tail-like protein